VIKLTTVELADELQTTYRRAYRVAHILGLEQQKCGNVILYRLNNSHPLVISMDMAIGEAKPIYSIAEIAAIWEYHGHPYSRERTRQLLGEWDIPIHNKENKGLVYLCDLVVLLKDRSANMQTNKQ
jgi:hypothetical protein